MEVRVPAGTGGGDATYCAHCVDPAVCVARLPPETRHMGRHQGLRRNRVSLTCILLNSTVLCTVTT